MVKPIHPYTQNFEYHQKIGQVRIDGEVMQLISYAPFYQTLFRKDITEYQLIFT